MELQRLRPGADPTHVATQDIDQLWQLVQSVATQERADARDARIGVPGEAGTGRALVHGAKLDHGESPSTPADAKMAKEDRTGAVQPDDKPDRRKDGK